MYAKRFVSWHAGENKSHTLTKRKIDFMRDSRLRSLHSSTNLCKFPSKLRKVKQISRTPQAFLIKNLRKS